MVRWPSPPLVDSLIEKKVSRNCLYKGHSVSFFKDVVLLPNGRQAVRDYMGHPGAVTVVPFLDRDRILMLRQYRYPVKKIIREIPAGKIDKGENPLVCARRELLEETGYWPRKIKRIISFWPTPAFADEIMHVYMAWDLIYKKAHTDPDEFLEPFPVRFSSALRWIKTGRIRDAKSIIALLAIEAFGWRSYVR